MDAEHRGHGHLHPLEPAGFKLALDAKATVRLRLHVHDDGGMRKSGQFRQDRTGLAVAEIVGLQAGEQQVEGFALQAARQQFRTVKGVEAREGFVFEENGAIRALGQRLAQHRLHPRWSGRQRDHLAAVLLF